MTPLQYFLFILFFFSPLLRPHISSSRSLTDESCSLITSPDTDGICSSMVTPHGYKCQEFEVKTEDGYILSMQRIPEGRVAGDGGANRQPVLLQHGILMDGMTWLLNSPEESLAFVLADRGFDVWIANTRGTKWSRQHVTLDPSSRAYWNWSWDELVMYDLPATFDFVFSHTGQKLDYVGHSLGTLIALASFSEWKLVDKLKSAALLCPVAYLTHMTTPIGILAARAFVGEITSWLGMAEFNPKGVAVTKFLNALCHNPGVDCYDLMTSFTGHNCCLNGSTVELFLKYEPQSTSTKTMVHLAQTFRDGVLTKFNYENTVVNLEHYGQAKPPVYNISNIPDNLSLFLSYGGKDSLSDVKDVQLLLDDLKFHNGDKLVVHYVEDFAHADFVMGVDAKEMVYNAVISFFDRQ
ncbi:triacylglycerol lipase 2-like [Dioscorea cayenensis subsp. rotundata]|uniref:Lipase n=1 Tax=Dioscorea cayennensis subsp. rotundata TaxID=55577 RepID=A0AB40B0D8_DIOCR|nr:triacylglycerol lipase 2-like [Dioscorea cayenensis subsp. rotundata]